MMPWIGVHYRQSPKRLLFLGESHYLPPSSAARSSEHWYSSSQDRLNPEELLYVSTAEIIKKSKAEGFKKPGHGIYKQIAKQLNESGRGRDSDNEAIEHCAFYNFFQRPAESAGGSIGYDASDKRIAQEVLEWFITAHRPQLVVVVSRKAGPCATPILEAAGVKYAVTPHPTCRWWNRAARAYGGKKGREIIPAFLERNNWLQETVVSKS